MKDSACSTSLVGRTAEARVEKQHMTSTTTPAMDNKSSGHMMKPPFMNSSERG